MFTILRIYSDFSTIADRADDMKRILSACTIYLEDPDCIGVKIWRTDTGAFILDYWKD